MRRSVVVTLVAIAAAVVSTATRAQAAPPAAGATGATLVRLITGDSVLVGTHGGRPAVSVDLRSHTGIAGRTSTVTLAGHTYVVPAAAQRYLGGALDLSLFDVTGPAQPAGRVPVTATVTAGSHPAVPGLTVTAHTATSLTGYLTPAGARTFGAALDAQWSADAKAHRVPATLFGGVARMATPGAVTVTPHFQQYTLQVRVLDPTGAPADSAFLVLTDVDNGNAFTNAVFVNRGLAKISVPAGHYSGFAEYDALSGSTVDSYLTFADAVPVTKNNTALTFDSRRATVVPSVATPRPTQLLLQSAEWDLDTADSGVGVSAGGGPGSTLHVMPVPHVSRGTLHWINGWQLSGTPANGTPYTYDLSYLSTGSVPANQSFTAGDAQVAAISSSYYTDQQARFGIAGRGAFYPFQFGSFSYLFGIALPTVRTEYVYASPGGRWIANASLAGTTDDPFQGFVVDTDRAYTPGEQLTADWGRGPLAPRVQQPVADDTAFFCGYCRTAHVLDLFFSPVSDSTPQHAGFLNAPDATTVVARTKIYRNGTLVKSLPNSTGAELKVSDAATTYRAVVTTSRGLAGFATSTSATEDVTFRSSATSGAPAPAAWFCGGCTVLPLLTANVPLPTDLEGTLAQGSTTFTFTVGHVAGASPSAVSGVTFAVSADGGSTFQNQPVTSLGGDRYSVTITDPASWAGRGIGVRVSAHDAAGGALVETTQNAYYVAQS